MTLEVNYRKAKNDTFKSNYKSLKVLCDDLQSGITTYTIIFLKAF